MGLLHHLSDDQFINYFEMLKPALAPGGKLITLDGVFQSGQRWLAKTALKNDRGKFVREKKGYLKIAESIFPKVNYVIREDIFNIPYTTIIMTCKN